MHNIQQSKERPKKKIKGKICMKAKGSESSPLRSRDSQAGRLERYEAFAKRQSETKLSSRGVIRIESVQVRWFSW